jgi:hypothetical protein
MQPQERISGAARSLLADELPAHGPFMERGR